MCEFAEWISGTFPHHAAGMRQELSRLRMTADRWNRISCILSSLMCIPGPGLTQDEKDMRGETMTATIIAQKMAQSTLGCTKYPDYCLDTADAWSIDLKKRISAT